MHCNATLDSYSNQHLLYSITLTSSEILSAWFCIYFINVANSIKVADERLARILHIQTDCLRIVQELQRSEEFYKARLIQDAFQETENAEFDRGDKKEMKTDSIKHKKYPSSKTSKKDGTTLTIRPETPPGPGAPSSPSENTKITINKTWLHYLNLLSCWGHIGRRYTCLLELSFILLSLVMCFASQLGTVSDLLEPDSIHPAATRHSSVLSKPRVQRRFGGGTALCRPPPLFPY